MTHPDRFQAVAAAVILLICGVLVACSGSAQDEKPAGSAAGACMEAMTGCLERCGETGVADFGCDTAEATNACSCSEQAPAGDASASPCLEQLRWCEQNCQDRGIDKFECSVESLTCDCV